MADHEYLPIAEFAEAVGVSKQAIYKRIEKDLAPFCEYINGRKCIAVSAMGLFIGSQKAAEPIGEETVPPPPLKHHVNDSSSINYLKQQIDEKDKLIAQQQETIADQAAQIRELQSHMLKQSAATTEILQRQSQLQENFQILLGQQQKQIEAFSSVSTVETGVKPVEQPVEQPIEIADVKEDNPVNTEHPSKKRGLFSKLFNG